MDDLKDIKIAGRLQLVSLHLIISNKQRYLHPVLKLCKYTNYTLHNKHLLLLKTHQRSLGLVCMNVLSLLSYPFKGVLKTDV
jgi:hypothetical protein